MLKAFNAAQKESSFVLKLSIWPDKETKKQLVEEVTKLAKTQLSEFLVALSVKYLAYEGVILSDVMNRHRLRQAPFSDSKPNEFPDAFALASLISYSKTNDQIIGVISADKDFESACKESIGLVYYPSIGKYISSLDADDKAIGKLSGAIEKEGIPLLEEHAKAEFPDLSFVHFEDDDADVEDIQVARVYLDEFVVLNYSKEECSVSAYLDIAFTASVRMGDPDSVSKDPESREFFFRNYLSGRINESVNLKTVLKCKLVPDGSKIESIRNFSFVDDLVSIGSRPDEEESDDPHEEYRER